MRAIATRLLRCGALLALAACNPPAEADPDPCAPATGTPVLDGWGGDERLSLEATGWFRTEKVCERWWLVTPDGHPFYSVGINSTRSSGDRNQLTGEYAYAQTVAAAYDSEEAWADATADRLREWGFSTVGAWSQTERFTTRMPVTPIVSLAGDDWVAGTIADYYAPSWQAAAETVVSDVVGPAAADPYIVGWFLDNEIRWGQDWRGTETLLQLYLALPAEAAGKQAAVGHLMTGLGDLTAVNDLLGTSFPSQTELLAATGPYRALDHDEEPAAELTATFLTQTADRYFTVATAAIRAVDGNHLILGNREVSVLTPAEVWQAAAPHVDVLSINSYVFHDVVVQGALSLSGAPDPADGFAALHALVDLPILVTEFGFRADGAGLPNTWPPIYPTLADQDARADAFEAYAVEKQAAPWVVGYHWFEWVDQPVDGRFDGEDNNWGLVSEADVPYPELTGRMAEVNPRIWEALEVPASP